MPERLHDAYIHSTLVGYLFLPMLIPNKFFALPSL